MALAMLLNLMVAALAGILHPARHGALRPRPAVGSSVFLTFITDSMGFFIFLGLATSSCSEVSRLFFAVWPDAAGAASLAALAAQLAEEAGGKPMPEAKIHLTLAFLGSIDEAARASAMEAARTMSGAPFEFRVDRTGSFRRARVAWAGVSQPSRELLGLQSALEAGLRTRGLALEERPYVPHVTLVRNCTRAIAGVPIPPVAWRVDAFTLVRSETGTGRYVVEERWALEG
jgi:2'-5' RNA ligase